MDHPITIILKRKRTKRQRPTTHNSASTSSYSDHLPSPPTTPEDEDTANCLLLLSKGRRQPNHDHCNNTIVTDHDSFKFNSKRYIQTVDVNARNGLTGIYVYECKTCSRTFPSFQALGGHRASHNKPRILINEYSSKPFCDDENYTSPRLLQFKKQNNNNNNNNSNIISSSSNSSSLSLQPKKTSSSKLHECSICGAEFNSGQALGGHMRRHRASNGNNAAVRPTNTTLSLIPYGSSTNAVITANGDVEGDDHRKSTRNDGLCLTLDLNLPAPPETTVGVSDQAQHRESSFKFPGNQNKQQQPSVHLSAAPTLVDCHY